jgi:hypothetical protein
MKKTYLILIPFILSCSFLKMNKKNNECVENFKFKKEFFKNIAYIENNILIQQDSTFRSSLIFISNYAQVSFHEMMNYSRTYPIAMLAKDKKDWLKWYEENKCTNIQLKDKYSIPERYKEFFEY